MQTRISDPISKPYLPMVFVVVTMRGGGAEVGGIGPARREISGGDLRPGVAEDTVC